MNHGMSKKLKSYDLTLCQADYDEKERIEVPDNVWETYKHYHKNKNRGRTGEESKPQTRKEWMMSIYFLAKGLFVDRFIKRPETSNQGVKCSRPHIGRRTRRGGGPKSRTGAQFWT